MNPRNLPCNSPRRDISGGKKSGQQFVSQPKSIAKKTARYR